MYLNVILTVLVIVLITMIFMVNRWWKKYGLTMFKTMDQLKGMNQNNFKSPNDLKTMMFDLQKIMGGWK